MFTSEPRVAFVMIDYPLGVSSMIINSARMFVRKGFFVDILINRAALEASPVEFRKDESISLVVCEDDTPSRRILPPGVRYVLRRVARILLPLIKLKNDSLYDISLWAWLPRLFEIAKWANEKLCEHDYRYVIPVEYASLLCVNHIDPAKVVYYNLELMDGGGDSPLYTNAALLKRFEHRMINRLSRVVIQSRGRAEAFARINRFDINKIHLLPVASMGNAVIEKSAFFRNKFGIPAEHKIVIYAGNLSPWAQCLDIIKTVRYWPPGYALVMHTWRVPRDDNPYLRRMRGAAGSKRNWPNPNDSSTASRAKKILSKTNSRRLSIVSTSWKMK